MRADSRLALWGGGILAGLALLASAAPWVAPADPAAQIDPVAGRYLPPGSQRLSVRLADGRTLLVERAEPAAGGLRVERLGEVRTLTRDSLADGVDEAAVPRRFLLGTDGLGRDVLSRLLWAARVSLTAGVAAALLALLLGSAVGGAAAMAGGVVDGLLMRLVDAMLAFPRLFLVVLLAAVFEAGEWVVILVLALTGWMATARLARAEVLALKRRDFVLAASALGQSPPRILWRHLLPNALTPLIVHTTLRVGNIILLEASLSFLGLGVQPPRPSWGNMVAQGADVIASAWWISTLPGVAIAGTVIACNLLGDGLRERLDPRRPGRAGRTTPRTPR